MTDPIDLAIVNGEVVRPHGRTRADVCVHAGRVVGVVAPGQAPPARRVIDAAGLHVLPGLIHVHCHFREPGHTYKEDFESGTRAAAAGGITLCLDMTNNDPHPTTLEAFERKRTLAEGKALVDFALYGGGLYPKTVAALARAGAIGIKIFNTRHVKEVYPYISELGVVDHGILHELFEAVADTGLVCSVHHDDSEWCKRMTFRDYIDRGRIDAAAYRECYAKGYMYGHGMVAGLAASLYYARLTGVRLHVLHLGVMPAGANELVLHAKRDLGQDVTAELEVASLLMSGAQAEKVGPFAYLWAYAPETNWAALADGTADMLVGEHAPHTVAEVEPGWQDNFSIPLGITGAQEFIPLLLTEVNRGRLSLETLVRMCSEQPAKRFGLYPRKGSLEVGADADLTIVDMRKSKTLTRNDMHTRSGHTSWEGIEVQGMPVHTIVRGETVVRDGTVVGRPGHGRFTPGQAAVA
ncbi:MAG TPA: dihydroorotase family protein [Casimicrobiaceae bacterium]|nr:dihydroorotase family protein [Casimicrobiaceae bacterium]